MAVEDGEVRGGALALLERPAPAEGPDRELWAFGVLIGLQVQQ